ncbi:MAG: hypothetical protein ACE5I5_16145, partial [Candidatus Heimdallarchaeota archaeon]
MKKITTLLSLGTVLLLCGLMLGPSVRTVPLSFGHESELPTNPPRILARNVTRTFQEMGIVCQLVADRVGSYGVTAEGPIHSPFLAGVFTATLHTRHTATTQGAFSPVPTSGYQLTANVSYESLGTTTLRPPVTQNLYEETIQWSRYLEDIPEGANFTLTLQATFHAMAAQECITFKVLPTSTLSIVAATPGTTTQPAEASQEGAPQEDPEEVLGEDTLRSTEPPLITVGPVVLRPLDTWKELPPHLFLLQILVLCALL